MTYTATVPSQYLTYGTSYRFRLTGWNVCGQGKFPYYYNFVTLSTTPKASPTLSVPVMTGALLTLSWTTFTDGNSTGGSAITGY